MLFFNIYKKRTKSNEKTLLSITAIAKLFILIWTIEGYIIDKDGKKMEGVIEVKDIKKPWSFEQTVYFFDKEMIGKELNKKDKKCKPGDIVEYGIGERRFKVVEYAVVVSHYEWQQWK